MAWNAPNNHYGQVPFWDFMASLDPNRAPNAGAGVDHHQPFAGGFPFPQGGFNPWGFGGWGGPWTGGPGGRGGWGGRHHRRGRRGENPEEEVNTDGERENNSGEEVAMNEKADSPETMRDAPNDAPDPPEEIPQPPQLPHRGFHGRGRGRCGGRGGGMRHHRHAHINSHHGPGPHHRDSGSPPPYGAPPQPPHHGGPGGQGFPWSFEPMMQALGRHPIAQRIRDYMRQQQEAAARRSGDNAEDDVESFTPPVDVFHTEHGWVLHVALPGAKKEDIGVNWDGDRSLLSISGVIYRPGDEAFLQGLVEGERKVGLFRRDVKLPPEGSDDEKNKEKEAIDGEGITARMEDGVLVVTVPTLEKEWTEVRKVDIL